MRGYPKFLNTRADYEYVKAHFEEEKWRKSFEDLLGTQYMWVPEKQLDSEADGINDETHRVVKTEETVEKDGATETITQYWQEKRETNERGKIFRVGFTVAEVEAILAS